jgi:VanZ family protein
LKAFLVAIGFGALMETVQFGFFPDRYFEILDLIANIIGSICGSAIYYYKIKK